MKRREFLAASAAAGLALVAAGASQGAEPVKNKDVLELRVYTFASAEQQKAYDQFLADVEIPALNRAGVGPVGVFKMLKSDNPKIAADSTNLWVLLPHKSAESVITLPAKLAADEAYQKAGAAVLDANRKTPAFSRIESSLLLSFDGVPQVQVPTKAPTRVLQLRIYEAHNMEQAARKIKMFNVGGELAIFRRSGMNPVFFGQALTGVKVPNLTYMLGFEDDKARAKGWDTFIKDPEWAKLKGDVEYKDSEPITITNMVLRPGVGSQI